MARSRRARGEGSVFQRKDGRWVVQIELGDGKRKLYYVKTKSEGIKKLRQAQNELEQGVLATGPDQTVKQYLEYWLEEVHKPTIRISTYMRYRTIVYTHIIPALGDIKLQKLTPQHVNSFYRQKEKDGLNPNTVVIIHRLLRKALENAVKWHYVSYNASKDVSPPRTVKHEMKPLTVEQAHTLLEVVRGQKLEAILTMALTTGMRRGELMALRWSDIDFENKSLQVRHTVSHYAGHGYVENEPKTAKGKRVIILPAFVVDVLKQHRVNQLESRLKVGSAWKDMNLVFPNSRGSYLRSHILLAMFGKVLAEAGLPHMRFHDLRHSAATLLLSMGVQMKVVQEILGHSNMSVTADVYSHMLPTMQQEAMSKWDDAFYPDDKGNGKAK
jgi:integrase